MKKMNICRLIFAVMLVLSFVLPPVNLLTGPVVAVTVDPEKVYCDATLEDEFTPNEVVIVVNPSSNMREYTVSDFSAIGCTGLEELTYDVEEGELCRIIKLTISGDNKQNVLDAIDVLEQRSDIHSAEPNYIGTLAAVPNDPHLSPNSPKYQWAVDNINLPEAWDYLSERDDLETVRVGVIDTGIDCDGFYDRDGDGVNDNELLGQVNIGLSRSYVSFGTAIHDILNHGTRVAGIIGAKINNEVGIAGICGNVELISLKVSVNTKPAEFAVTAVAAAIEYATNNNIPILNLSGGFAGKSYNDIETFRVKLSLYPGLLICAAGNDNFNNSENTVYPGNLEFDNILVVGASTSTDRRWVDSQDGDKGSNFSQTDVDIFAPGANVVSCRTLDININDDYIMHSTGTSFAAAHVTGVAALILSAYPELTAEQVKTVIMASARTVYDEQGNDVFETLCVSGGILDAHMALVYAHRLSQGIHVFDIVDNGLLAGHSTTCVLCGHVLQTMDHVWVEYVSYYECRICGHITAFIPVNPAELDLTTLALPASYQPTSNYAVALDENTYLCIVGGQYYLVKSNSETAALQLLLNELNSITGG